MYAFMKQLFPTYSSFTRTIVLNLLIVMYRNLYNQLLECSFILLFLLVQSLQFLIMFIVIKRT